MFKFTFHLFLAAKGSPSALKLKLISNFKLSIQHFKNYVIFILQRRWIRNAFELPWICTLL